MKIQFSLFWLPIAFWSLGGLVPRELGWRFADWQLRRIKRQLERRNLLNLEIRKLEIERQLELRAAEGEVDKLLAPDKPRWKDNRWQ